jgi:hypothetical protein
MEELKQEDIFAIKKAEQKVEESKEIPMGFVPVTFCTKNKLGPEVLHFRNYSMEELYELTSATEESIMEILINRVLKSMCFEKYDLTQLHPDSISEIMMTIYANFWGSKIRKPYYKDLEIDDMESDDNIGYYDIEIKTLKLKNISDNVKVPFTIIDDITQKKIKFILPKIKHGFITEKFIKEKYKEQESEFYVLNQKFQTRKKLLDKKLFEEAGKIKINPEEETSFEQFNKNKMTDYLKVTQSQLIHSVDGKVLETIEDKIKAFENDIDTTTWKRFGETVEKYFDFGFPKEFTFKLGDETITRRFSFRYTDFVPSMDEKRDTGYTVSFDD